MIDKTCTKCSQTKPLNEFLRDKSRKSGYKQPCQKCNSKQSAAWQRSNTPKANAYLERQRIRVAERTKNLRGEVLQIYGNKCACCGETEHKFLGVDHIYNDGATHRRELGFSGGDKFYQWLKKNGFPKDRFQLLCHNCNCAKGFYGECPHKNQQIRRA